MLFFRSKLLKGFLSFICSFYLAILLQSHYNLSYPYFIFTGLTFFVICFYAFRYFLDKHNDRLFNKNVALASIGIAALIMLAFGRSVNPAIEADGYTVIKVTALGEKSDSSKASEVWIQSIFNENSTYDINRISLPTGWEKRDHVLLSHRHQPASIEVKIDDPVAPRIQFLKHPWSGKVKIEEGGKSVILDLYKDPSETAEYNSNNTVITEKKYNLIEKALLIGLSLLAIFIICYLLLITANLKNNLFLSLIPASLLLFYIPNYLKYESWTKTMLVIISIVTCIIMTRSKWQDFIATFSKTHRFLFYLISIYAGFAFIGHSLFFSHSTENRVVEASIYSVISKIAFLVLYSGWLSFFSVAFLYFTHWTGIKFLRKSNPENHISNKPYSLLKLYSIFLGILLGFWGVYLFAFYPGNLTTDSLTQWGQLIEKYPYNDWLPIFHTLIYKFLLSIWFTPAIISITQMLFMGAVCSSFLVFLYKAGVPIKWLITFAVILGIIPANGIYIVTLWKDLAYCCSILWLTLVLIEIVTKTYIFNYRTTLVLLVLSIFCVATLRHNGLLAVMIVVCSLIIWGIKIKRRELVFLPIITLIAIFSFNKIVRTALNVSPIPQAVRLTTPMHGIAAVIFYDGKLSDHTHKEMLKILPDSAWKRLYYPYSADSYLFRSDRPFMDDLSKWSTSKGIRLYLDAFKNNPQIVICDRFYGTELLWNVSQGEGSFNYIYATTIYDNPYGLRQWDNPLKKHIINFLEFTVAKSNSILWRAGLYNLLSLLLLLLLIKRHSKFLVVFMPLLGANFSLAIAMAHQDFRYVYYVPLLFGFVWLFAASNLANVKINNKQTL